MSFYRNEIIRMNKMLYPHDGLTRQIKASKLYIDKHYPDDINLDKISAKAFVSKFHFIRLFKKYYGRTPNQYLQEVRIENAKKLLQEGNSIDEVCISVGFKSKTSFISLFKRTTGYTPLGYRDKKSNFEE